jgi:hypothetical protein
MFALAAVILSTSKHVHQDLNPLLWMDLKGNILVKGEQFSPQVDPGVYKINTPDGVAYNFAGAKSGLLFGDNAAFKQGGSMTVSAWLYPRSYAPNGAQSEILFRGDDRLGYDPYCFAITNDGLIRFVVENDKSEGMDVAAELPLNRWTHVTASLNASNGELAMWLNGVEVAIAHTSKRPFVDLIPQYTPGVGVGNVQNDKGPHNQPYNGMLADLRFYDKVLSPEEVGFVVPRNNIQP